MGLMDDAAAAATMPFPGVSAPEDMQKALDAMSVSDLAGCWCALQQVGIADQTDSNWAMVLYFDRLPHDAPERALDLVLEVLRTARDRGLRLELGRQLMPPLLVNHGAALIDRLEREAKTDAAVRWLIGGTAWWSQDERVQARLRAVGDEAAWRRDDEAHRTPAVALDYETMSLPELARAWVEQKAKPAKDRDENWHALSDHEHALIENDPDRMLDLVLAVLSIETNWRLLSVLAAGPLEDVISMAVIDRIEQEAAANERFHDLLRGVWYSRKPDDVKARLDAILQPNA